MKVTHDVRFDVDLSGDERTAMENLIGSQCGRPCEVAKVGSLTVKVTVEMQEKKPQGDK